MQYTGFYNDRYIADRYRRLDLAGDVLYHTYRFGSMTILFPKQKNTVTVFTDSYAHQMVERGIITDEARQAYESAVCAMYPAADCYQDLGALQTYRMICQLRRQILGREALEQAREMDCAQPITPVRQSICEDAQKEKLLLMADTAVFLLYDAQYLSQMRQDVEISKAAGHRICVLTSRDVGDVLPTQQTLCGWLKGIEADYVSCDEDLETTQWDARLQEDIDMNRVAVFAYGEEALLTCRSLRVDAIVTASPKGHCTRALINQLGCDTACTVYVPRHLDITQFVPLTDKTRLSYWHLAMLRRDVSAEIDSLSLEELYRRYPAYFLNRYENGADCAAADAEYPISITIPENDTDPVSNFEQYREAAVADYISSFEALDYQCAYFDDMGNQREVPWNAEGQQKGILVNAVRVKRAKGSKVIACGNGVTLRQRLQNEGTGIVSNFLFFLTPKLAALYNDLRKDRPYEQANLGAEHLDYMLTTENGIRRETFPLFRKTCIGMKENGEFLFFNFRLGSGKVRIDSQEICWDKADVDPEEPKTVCVYTPYASLSDGDADRQTYRKIVGQGRVNFIFLQDRLHCIHSGDVILPSVGVVVSLEKSRGEALLNKLQLNALGDGYYAPGQMQTEIKLDPPEGVSKEKWAQVCWAYGGGLSLILDHKAVSDQEDMLPWFEAEGWMSPLSRQTQESTLHTLVKHPRTAIGIADNGDLLILVFSGRTWISTGADYREMCHIARILYPDVHSLMNADGGGSAVLGLVCQGSFMELSYPSTSAGSTVGMVRPIQTAFCIKQEETKI